MDIKKIYRRFFYLNTGSKTGNRPTSRFSSLEAFILLGIFSSLKKILFPTLDIAIFLVFSFFLILCFTLDYFNEKVYKRQNTKFKAEWKNETRKTRIMYKFCNVVFIISIFSILIYILEYLDNKFS